MIKNHFESMIYKYLTCQILGHDFDEKSDFLNYEFSKRSPVITQFKNGRVQKRVGSREHGLRIRSLKGRTSRQSHGFKLGMVGTSNSYFRNIKEKVR